ncbi:hypothetical protein AVEN_35524-1 [Araneus ventricosus]|uniref:Uncharacterized protein n=1 Tax=Araneus ventricosus TaxID=182803 RepID=A0A4Y2GPJ1_ARAVE|nr:hypothetical protein AVEN_35524-1 [Araneus ventricosus]
MGYPKDGAWDIYTTFPPVTSLLHHLCRIVFKSIPKFHLLNKHPVFKPREDCFGIFFVILNCGQVTRMPFALSTDTSDFHDSLMADVCLTAADLTCTRPMYMVDLRVSSSSLETQTLSC